jgi:hypothetical protein
VWRSRKKQAASNARSLTDKDASEGDEDLLTSLVIDAYGCARDGDDELRDGHAA